MTFVYLLGSCELTEAAVLKEVIFAFQGIAGKYVHYDSARECFTVDPKVWFYCTLLIFSFRHFLSCKHFNSSWLLYTVACCLLLELTVILSLEFCISMFINLYIARPTYRFF